MKRTILIVIAALVVVVVAGIFFLASNLNSLVAKAIREAGGRTTGTEVSVGGVEIGIKEGRGTVRGLGVGNPEGFSRREAFTLDEVTIDIDVKSIRGADPVVIELVRIASPDIFFEVKEKGESNFDAIRKHAQSMMPSSGDADASSGPRILIRSIQFEEGHITGDASALGAEAFEVVLPSFTLSNIGAPNGAPAAEIGKIIVTALTKKTIEAVARDKAGSFIKDEVEKSVGDKLRDLVK